MFFETDITGKCLCVENFDDNTERKVSVSHTHFLIQFVVVSIMSCRSVTGIIAINEERDLVSFL